MVVSRVTRGTTGAQRLRRVDRWLVGARAPVLLRAARPLVVDLGFGAGPGTTLEMAARLARVRPDVEVVGVEVAPDRVEAAREGRARALAGLAAGGAVDPAVGAALARVRFAVGGFDLEALRPPGGRDGPGGTAGSGGQGGSAGDGPVLVRAANVLRQYDEAEVAPAWRALAAAMAPGGLLVDLTCDEVGRRAAWVAVRRSGGGEPVPESLTLSVRLSGLERPGEVAARLPKALIHRNVAGEGVHDFLRAADAAWAGRGGGAWARWGWPGRPSPPPRGRSRQAGRVTRSRSRRWGARARRPRRPRG